MNLKIDPTINSSNTYDELNTKMFNYNYSTLIIIISIVIVVLYIISSDLLYGFISLRRKLLLLYFPRSRCTDLGRRKGILKLCGTLS